MFKKAVFSLLAAAFFLSCFAFYPTYATDLKDNISAKSFVVYDPLTRKIVLENNAHQKRGMASTTKIMTAALALDLYDLDEKAEVSPSWCGIEGSSMYLKPGEIVTVRELIYGALLMSGNDAAKALAALHPGGETGFIDAMNCKAAELYMADTSFENPSGLDGENHFSTAYDMALLAAWAMEIPAFAEIAGTKSGTFAGRYMTNHNKLLSTLDGADGVKTGYTKASGRCLVSSRTVEGRRLIIVTLSAPNDWEDHEKLYNNAFDGLEKHSFSANEALASVPLVGGAKDTVGLCINNDINLTLLKGEQARICLLGPRFVYNSAVKGNKWGRYQVKIGDAVIEEGDVFFYETVAPIEPPKKSFFSDFFNTILRIFR